MSTAGIDRLPGLKEAELAKLGPCPICGNKLLATGDVTFYVVEISRAGWDARALRTRAGLEMMLGSGSLAQVMGPDQDLASIFDGPRRVAVHESCAGRVGHLLRLFGEGA